MCNTCIYLFINSNYIKFIMARKRAKRSCWSSRPAAVTTHFMLHVVSNQYLRLKLWQSLRKMWYPHYFQQEYWSLTCHETYRLWTIKCLATALHSPSFFATWTTWYNIISRKTHRIGCVRTEGTVDIYLYSNFNKVYTYTYKKS